MGLWYSSKRKKKNQNKLGELSSKTEKLRRRHSPKESRTDEMAERT